MPHDPQKHLFDILQACELIADFTKDKSLEQFKDNALLRSAVERQFQIIREALSQLLRRFPDLSSKITDYQDIINFRHILVHGYDRIEDDVTWGVIQANLPVLKKEIEDLLKQ